MEIYDEIMSLLEHRMVSNHKRLAPLYICSIGCHVFNVINKKIKVFTEGALVADCRLHVIMVTVPGFGKSFMLKQFLDDEVGILASTKLSPRWCASMTTASFIGTMKSDSEGNPVIHEGICSKYKGSVIGVHEFAEITNSMTLSYNVGLADALLSALDDGKVRKDVMSGEISYETMITLFSAVQPARYNLASGLGRRLAFLVYVPSVKDIENLRMTRRKSRHVKDDRDALNRIRGKINELYNTIPTIKAVRFTTRFYDWMDKQNIIPYEEILYERIGIGYWIMNGGIKNGELVVDMDERLREICEHQKADRFSVKSGVDTDQVWRVIKEVEVIEKDKLIEMLLEFSLGRQLIHAQLKSLQAMNWITVDGIYVKVVKR